MLQGYFFVHNISNRENITVALLKFVPHLKDWWDTFYEKNKIEKTYLFKFALTWDSFMDSITKQYYHGGSYDDLYIGWTTMQ
jgi:hypothetical protein